MSFDRYLTLTWYRRWAMHEELTDLIEATNPPEDDSEGGGGPSERPKRLRR
jgi:hypothetical protein